MKLGEIIRKPIIYLDMDGVLANFKKKAMEILKVDFFDGNQEQWDELQKHKNIYADLEKLEDADHLVNEVKKLAKKYNYDVQILTAVPRLAAMPHAEKDKFNWIEKHYKGLKFNVGPFSRDKWTHAKDGDILIDDRKSNIKHWIKKANQNAILHKTAKQSIEELRDVLGKRHS